MAGIRYGRLLRLGASEYVSLADNNVEPRTAYRAIKQEPRRGDRSPVTFKTMAKSDDFPCAHSYLGMIRMFPNPTARADTLDPNSIAPPKTELGNRSKPEYHMGEDGKESLAPIHID